MATWQTKDGNRKKGPGKVQNLQKDIQNSKFSNWSPSSVPPVSLQLAHLTPTKELLLHYHQKIIKYEDEWKEITAKLDHYSRLYNNEHILEKQIQAKNEEILQLQKALSNIQASLFQEREHCLRLYAENDDLKFRELEDRKQIHHLLALCGKVNLNYKNCYMEEPKASDIPERLHGGVNNQINGKKSASTSSLNGDERNATNGEIQNLRFQVEALKVQLAEKEALYFEQVEALRNNCDAAQKNAEAQHRKDVEKIDHLLERLKEVNELLKQTTKDYINFRKTVWNAESQWAIDKIKLLEENENVKMQAAKYKEKSDLMEELSSVKEELSNCGQQMLLIDEINALKRDLNNSISSLIDELRHVHEQLTSCSEQISLQREMCTESIQAYNKKQDLLKKQLFEKNYQKLQRNLSTAMKNIANIEKQASDLHRTSTSDIETFQQQIDQQGRVASIEESLGTMKSLNGNKASSNKVQQRVVDHDSENLLLQEMNQIMKASEIYQSRNLLLIEELNKLKETHNITLQFYKDRCQRLENQLELKTSQQQEFMRFHRLQVEGFKSDVKLLKDKLLNVEKQLLKATLQLECSPNVPNDLTLLKVVHSTTVNAKEIANDLKTLKCKLYQIENDLKGI